EVIESSIEMSSPYLEKKNIDVVRHVKTDVKMYCDGVHMQEVLRNLIKNAAEAMEHNGQLRISAYDTRKAIVIEVQDNGPGIDQEDLTRIFHPYFTTKNRSKNFGLGLAYCMNVMHKHGGKIDVQSKKGLGTTFILQIPITEQPV
ncbi:sensor histidine kinase, partial [Paenibacillus polymyxa]